MPRTYKRKTEKSSWSADDLQSALTELKNGSPLREVARRFGIPRSTLQDQRKRGNTSKLQLGRCPVFSEEQEGELSKEIINLSKLFFGITPAQIQQSAYTYAKLNNLANRFNKEKESAGRDWLEGFLRRNPQISLRKPEPTSVNRVTAFNKLEVGKFYENLNKVMERYKFSPTRIFNADETGITTVQRPGKIYAEKGQKRVGYLTSWEKGKTTTAMCAFSATGVYVPPMFIYARKRMADHLNSNGPPGAIYRCSDNGWITEDLFVDWLKHFEYSVKASQEDLVLLVLDNHSSHCSLNAYNLAKKRGLLCSRFLPTHPIEFSHSM
ncbi:tigger transposable element-derived protein 6-like [Photinus pyralis]|uniref:tigger transposable element-derived protein 6-like n=1 Tax=Photinus pyralis TaxID=7054 RepID=UPI0012677122|nr:tigger transposable element-derived protein 6-like [Photinus pyralis]